MMTLSKRICGPLSLAVLFSFSTGFPATVKEGDSINRVQAVLGSPNGAISVNEKNTFFFDRGEVIFIDGVVTEIKLINESAAAVKHAREERRRELSVLLATELNQQRIIRGLKLKNEKLNSLKFKITSAQSRVHYWRNFRRVYPEIDISDQLDAALFERDEEINRIEEETRLAEIEARLLAAERRARYRYSVPYYPGFSHGHVPVVENPVPQKATPPNRYPTFIAAELKR